MLLRTTIKMSLQNLRKQKMRTFLTMLGIIIGISSVILISSVIAGAESLITNQLQGIGTNLIGVLPGGTGEDGPPAAVFGIVITTLKDDDTEALKDRIPQIVATSSYVSKTEVINYENQKTTASIYGVSADYPKLSETDTLLGNFFTEDDKKSQNNVIVLGHEIWKDLFDGNNPIGQKIQIGQTRFTVIGVMKEQGSVGFQNTDRMVFMPVTTAQKRVLGIDYLGYMRLKVDKKENIAIALEQVNQILRERHNIDDPAKDDFTARDSGDAAETLGTVTNALQFFLIAVVSISLLVGGIGIMNIMLAAVIERIREIGLRKAVGATKKQIVWQFLIETLIIAFLGAIIGLLLGIFLSFLVSIIINKLGYDWNFVITNISLIISIFFTLAIGVIFGLYPAQKASKLNPIESLRYE